MEFKNSYFHSWILVKYVAFALCHSQGFLCDESVASGAEQELALERHAISHSGSCGCDALRQKWNPSLCFSKKFFHSVASWKILLFYWLFTIIFGWQNLFIASWLEWRLATPWGLARAENPLVSVMSRYKLVGAVPPGKRPARTKINPCYNAKPFKFDLVFFTIYFCSDRVQNKKTLSKS